MTTAGARLRLLRQTRSLSVRECARRIGQRHQRWLAYEADERTPNLSTAHLIALALGLQAHETHYLVTGKTTGGPR